MPESKASKGSLSLSLSFCLRFSCSFFFLSPFSFFSSSSWTCAECLKSIVVVAAAALGNDGRDDDPKTKAFSFPFAAAELGDTVQTLNFLAEHC